LPIFELKSEHIDRIEETSFAEMGISERSDLQRLLRKQFEVIAPDILIVAEEFGEWERSKRRIDLLGLDREANLVVIELKRTEDGGHMELQALRYAAMVSTITFDKAVDVYDSYLKKIGEESNAKESILSFLGWEDADEDKFAQDVRIFLISAEFSKELTTSVLWLNERGLDIRCVRIKPYRDKDRILIDVQQIIPIQETEEYLVQIRVKTGVERIDRAGRGPRHKLRLDFWEGLLKQIAGKTELFSFVSPSENNWITSGASISGISFSLVIRKHDAAVQLVIDSDKEKNKLIFDSLYKDKSEIEHAFGGQLDWMRSDDLKKSYINKTLAIGGNWNARSEWPDIQLSMIDTLVSMETAFVPFLKML